MPEPAGQLWERERELAGMRAALETALSGQGNTLVLEGPAGIGKSALLRTFPALAEGTPARVLTAVGGELERDFPFGMVRQLLEPVVLADTDARREELFSGASAMAAPVFGQVGGSDDESADATFAVLHGIYWLVAALAEEQPLVLVLDDLHWADGPSLRFLDFLVRRLADLPVLLVLGLRPREPGADWELLDGIMAASHAATLRPALLSVEAAGALVNRELGAGQDVAVAAHETTGGNPLLLRELTRTLAAGEAVTERDVHEAVPSSVARSVERRLRRLPDGAQTLAAAMAVLDDGRGQDLLEVVTGQGAKEVERGLAALRDADLATESARFVHPLMRQAVAEAVDDAEHDRLHMAAAQALRGQPAAADRMVLHLLAADLTGTEWAVDALVEAGNRALADGAPDAAVRRLRRAAEERPDDAEVQYALGVAELRLGDLGSLARFSRAAELATDAETRARCVFSRLAVISLSGTADMPVVAQELEDTLASLPDQASDLAEDVRGMLANVLVLTPELLDARKRFVFESDAADSPTVVPGTRALELAAGDAPAAEIETLAEASLAQRPLARISHAEARLGGWGVSALFLIDGAEISDAAITDAEQIARSHTSRIARGGALQLRVEWLLHFGSVATGESMAREATELFDVLDSGVGRDTIKSSLADCLVRLGRLEEAEEVLGTFVAHDPPAWLDAMPHQARAALRMAQGRPGDAVADLEVVRAIADRLGVRSYYRGFPEVDRAEALAAAGRREEATALAEQEIELARRSGRPTHLVAALTVLGQATDGERSLAALAEAHELAPTSKSPFRRARARLAYGAALRRDNNRVEAREVLRLAQADAERAGARIVGDAAVEELTVAGGRPRIGDATGAGSLTPSERRVAELAAQGLTNREIAETLFVTQKTVEVHLGHTYGKLEIRSRTQLAGALSPSG